MDHETAMANPQMAKQMEADMRRHSRKLILGSSIIVATNTVLLKRAEKNLTN